MASGHFEGQLGDSVQTNKTDVPKLNTLNEIILSELFVLGLLATFPKFRMVSNVVCRTRGHAGMTLIKTAVVFVFKNHTYWEHKLSDNISNVDFKNLCG